MLELSCENAGDPRYVRDPHGHNLWPDPPPGPSHVAGLLVHSYTLYRFLFNSYEENHLPLYRHIRGEGRRAISFVDGRREKIF